MITVKLFRTAVIASASAASIFLSGALMAQQPATKPPVVEGDWVRTDTNGSGSFDNLTKSFKPAVLTPEGQAMMAAGGRGGRGGGGRGGPPGAGGPGGRGGAGAEPGEAHVAG